MKSIRGTLLLYFLALEALVLGAVSFYAYGVTAADLHAKDERTQRLLEAHYRDRSKDIHEKFDEETLRRAQQLSRLVAHQWGQPLQKFLPLGIIAEMTQPFGYVASAAWAGSGVEGPLGFRVQNSSSIQFVNQVVQPDEDYYMIRSEVRRTVMKRSDSLGGRELPLSRDTARQLDSFESSFQDVELEPGHQLRLVTLKVPLYKSTHYNPFGLPPLPMPPRRSSSGGGRGGNQGPARWSPPQRGSWVQANMNIFVQYARDTDARDARIKAYLQGLEEDKARVHDETQTALLFLRDKLVILCLVTFALTVLGGTLLVHLALRPLGRIADAVSRVSEKDFHLHIAAKDVPMEMLPIVRRLQESLTSLAKAFAHEKQAVADISHELRTPLASLMATIQVCLRKPRGTEEYRVALENCLDIADHLHQLVEQLLTLARLDSGAIPMQMELVNVTELAEQCADMIRPLADEKNLTLHVKLGETVETETDAGKLKEIVTNLLSNAVQYNRPQGEIILKVRQQDRQVCVEVTDTGIGITDESRRHLFERFYRADPSRHSDEVHAGLGLSIVKGYLDLLGGSIEVDSTPDRGSTFRVWLPLRVPVEEPLAVG
jgi:signal transduction histidine kinase